MNILLLLIIIPILTIIGIIFTYCLAYALLRLSVSPSLELDESLQLLTATGLVAGFNRRDGKRTLQ